MRSKAELLSRFEEAMAARTVAANYKHEYSSRAHTVLRIRVESAFLVASERAEGDPSQLIVALVTSCCAPPDK